MKLRHDWRRWRLVEREFCWFSITDLTVNSSLSPYLLMYWNRSLPDTQRHSPSINKWNDLHTFRQWHPLTTLTPLLSCTHGLSLFSGQKVYSIESIRERGRRCDGEEATDDFRSVLTQGIMDLAGMVRILVLHGVLDVGDLPSCYLNFHAV